MGDRGERVAVLEEVIAMLVEERDQSGDPMARYTIERIGRIVEEWRDATVSGLCSAARPR